MQALMIDGEQDIRHIRGEKRGKNILRNLHDGEQAYHRIGEILWGSIVLKGKSDPKKQQESKEQRESRGET